MAIGERIHFFRTLRGMTQKYLGMAVGFPGQTYVVVYVRDAQRLGRYI